MAWQSMKSAPREGGRDEPFVAFHAGDYWSLLYWDHARQAWCTYWDGDPVSDEFPPVAWQALPEPPHAA